MDEELLDRWEQLQALHDRVKDVLAMTNPVRARASLVTLEFDLARAVESARDRYVDF